VSVYGRYGRSFPPGQCRRIRLLDGAGGDAEYADLARCRTRRPLGVFKRPRRAARVPQRADERDRLRPQRDRPEQPVRINGANINFDPTRREGLELELTQTLAANANLRINAATRRARFTAGAYQGKDVPLTPRHTLSVRADWSPAAGHRIDGGVNVVSSQSPDFDHACRMPSYTTADLRYAYQWSLAELAVESRIWPTRSTTRRRSRVPQAS